MGRLEVVVPPVTALAGVTVYVQALIVNDTQPLSDAHLTGYTADVILR